MLLLVAPLLQPLFLLLLFLLHKGEPAAAAAGVCGSEQAAAAVMGAAAQQAAAAAAARSPGRQSSSRDLQGGGCAHVARCASHDVSRTAGSTAQGGWFMKTVARGEEAFSLVAMRCAAGCFGMCCVCMALCSPLAPTQVCGYVVGGLHSSVWFAHSECGFL